MNFIKKILFFPITIIKVFIKGFKSLSLFLSRGFYFYFESFFRFLSHIFSFSFFEKASKYFGKRREDPSHIVFIIIWFLLFVYLFDSFYVDNSYNVQSIFDTENTSDVINDKNDNSDNMLLSKDLNWYRKFSKYRMEDINFNELKGINPDTVLWIQVDGTSINYPVVQTSNNDYYLSHSFDKAYSTSGWVFMDYRNDIDLNNNNTIFYGHNLLNKTGFGSLSKIFKSKDGNHRILILTADNVRYTYEIFSGYYIDPEVYYLQNNFYSDDDYKKFLDVLKERNILSVNADVSVNDKIITLSTCTDDNKGRKVIHARLVNDE